MATIRERNGRLYLRFYDAAGKRQEEALGPARLFSRADLNRILREKSYEAYTAHGTPLAPTFGDFVRNVYAPWHAAQYPASHERVAGILLRTLLPVFDQRRMDTITKVEIEEWKARRLREGVVKTATVVKELRTLKAVFNHAIVSEQLERSPAEHVSSPQILDAKPHTFYTAADLARLYAACVEPWHAAAWKLYANTGMRREEGLLLEKKWVTATDIKVVSTESGRTKSGKWRAIPLTSGARDALAELARLVQDKDHVLPQIAPESLSRACAKDLARAGLDGSLHTLRHTFISHLMLNPGVPIRKIQMWAGHSSITTTEKYAYLRADVEAGLSNLNL